MNGGKVEDCSKIKDGKGGGWRWKSFKCEGLGSSILRIFIL